MNKLMKWMSKSFYFLPIALLALISCDKDDNQPNPDSGKIKTEKKVDLTRQTIGSSGGQLVISGSASPLEGLQINVPADAYPDSREFEVSYSSIVSHELGQYFNPVSPLIEIKNGGDLANKMMNLRIPVQESAGKVRMAFYYDKTSGELEGIPIVQSSADFLEVAVRHFSLIVVTEVQKGLIIQGGGFHTLFDPLINGWSFVNDGTYPEAGGICAGMSIGAAYYFKNFK